MRDAQNPYAVIRPPVIRPAGQATSGGTNWFLIGVVGIAAVAGIAYAMSDKKERPANRARRSLRRPLDQWESTGNEYLLISGSGFATAAFDDARSAIKAGVRLRDPHGSIIEHHGRSIYQIDPNGMILKRDPVSRLWRYAEQI